MILVKNNMILLGSHCMLIGIMWFPVAYSIHSSIIFLFPSVFTVLIVNYFVSSRLEVQDNLLKNISSIIALPFLAAVCAHFKAAYMMIPYLTFSLLWGTSNYAAYVVFVINILFILLRLQYRNNMWVKYIFLAFIIIFMPLTILYKWQTAG